MALRNLLVRVGADITGFTSGMDKAQKRLQKFGQSISGLGLLAKGLASIGAVLGSALAIGQGTEDAIKYEALMDTLGQTLGESREDFIKWQEQVGSSMGFSKLQGADLANTMSLNFKAMATDQADLLSKTTKMMETAAIIANKRGLTMEDVGDRIRSAMNGEADAADELGVNVRIAAIQQSKYYKEMAQGQPFDKLSESMRDTILYHHILDSVAKDLGTTLSDNVQLKMVNFRASVNDVRLALGQAFLPILYNVLPLLTRFMRGLEKAMQYIAAFIEVMFKYRLATKEAKKHTKQTDKQSKSMGKLGDNAIDTGKKIKKAGADAKRGLADFDQIHILAEPTAKDGGLDEINEPEGAGDLAPSQDEIDRQSTWNQKISEYKGKLEDLFKNLTGFQTFKDGWNDFLDSMDDLYNSDSVQWFITNFTEDLPDFFSDLAQIGGGGFGALGGMIDMLNGLANSDWGKFSEGLGDVSFGLADIGSGIVGLVFPDVSKSLDTWINGLKTSWSKVHKQFFEGKDSPMETGKEIAKSLLGGMLVDFATLYLKLAPHWDDVKKSASKKLKSIPEDLLAEFGNKWAVDLGLKGVAGYNKLKEKFKAVSWKKDVVDPLKKTFEDFTKLIGPVISITFKTQLNKWIDKLNTFITGFNNVKNKIPLVKNMKNIDTVEKIKLAQGGIVNRPTNALIGEAGTEAVLPLQNNTGWMDDLANALASKMGNVGAGNNNGDIVIKIGNETIGRIAINSINRMQRQSGVSMLRV